MFFFSTVYTPVRFVIIQNKTEKNSCGWEKKTVYRYVVCTSIWFDDGWRVSSSFVIVYRSVWEFYIVMHSMHAAIERRKNIPFLMDYLHDTDVIEERTDFRWLLALLHLRISNGGKKDSHRIFRENVEWMCNVHHSKSEMFQYDLLGFFSWKKLQARDSTNPRSNVWIVHSIDDRQIHNGP